MTIELNYVLVLGVSFQPLTFHLPFARLVFGHEGKEASGLRPIQCPDCEGKGFIEMTSDLTCRLRCRECDGTGIAYTRLANGEI